MSENSNTQVVKPVICLKVNCADQTCPDMGGVC